MDHIPPTNVQRAYFPPNPQESNGQPHPTSIFNHLVALLSFLAKERPKG